MTEHDDARMRRLGVSTEQAEALQALWGTPTMWPVLSETAIGMQLLGYDPTDALDVAWHRLHHSDASLFLRRGFTPHQAFLLTNNEQAQTNIFGGDTEPDDRDGLLNTQLPRDILTELLLVADSPSEAQQFVSDIATSPEQPDGFIDDESPSMKAFITISKRAALANVRGDMCDCEPRPGG